MQALLEQTVIARRLATLLNLVELTVGDCARMVALTALHDVGKVNHAFQEAPFIKRQTSAGHIKPLLALLEEGGIQPLVDIGGLSSALHLLALANQDDVPLPFRAILAHHGHLPSLQAGDARREIWQSSLHYDPLAACRDLVEAVRVWCPTAFEPVQIAWTPVFEHAFAGLVTLADWLGSDTGHFKFPEDGAPDGTRRFVWALQKARALLSLRGLAPEQARQAVACLPFTAKTLTGFDVPSPAQAAMLRLPEAAGGRTCLIEDETGSGKTEAALIHFVDLFRRGEVDGMYFALPTRAAARDIYGRIKRARRCLTGEVPPVILAVPGYMPGPLTDPALPATDVLWNEDAAAAARDALWAGERPKRYLAGWVAVGTIDQVLMGGLQVRHAQLRSGMMLRLLLVVDEVHSSDVYMTALLRNVLNQHRRAGGHALLMSATLGSAARVKLLRTNDRATPLEPTAAVAIPYPATWSDAAPDAPLARTDAPRAAGKQVRVVLEPNWSDGGSVVARALAAARQGARVLVIRNTVRSVVATQQALEAIAPELLLSVAGPCGIVRTPHHARYAPEDRTRLDAALKAVLGKKARRSNGSIACASQTAEQSLDIDADLLITDLCPADVLLQRIGRLHRHRQRPRPGGFGRALCVVLAPGQDELAATIKADGEVGSALLGLGLVYPALLGVLATRRVLVQRDVIDIPADNRRLVEAATHPTLLKALAGELSGCWMRRWEHELGRNGAQAKAAQHARLDWSKPVGPLPNLDERITTRLGLNDRSVELPDGMLGPFGYSVTRLNVPGRWLRGVAVDAATVVEQGPIGELRFTVGDRRLVYDRLGLRPS